MVERFLIVVVAASDNQAVGVGGDLERRQHVAQSSCDATLGSGKAFCGDVLGAVVDNPNEKIEFRRQFCHRLSDMTATDDYEPAPRQFRQKGNPVCGARARARLQLWQCLGDCQRDLVALVARAAMGQQLASGIEQVAVRRAKAACFGVEDYGFHGTLPRDKQLVELRVVLSRGFSGEWIDKRLHATATDKSVVPAVVVVELKPFDGHRARLERGERFAFDFGFDAAAAERARLRTIGKHQHRRAGFLRRRATGFHEAAKSHFAIRGQSGQQIRQQISHHSCSLTRAAGANNSTAPLLEAFRLLPPGYSTHALADMIKDSSQRALHALSMNHVDLSPPRLPSEPLPDNLRSVQPGGGVCYQVELAWGRCRRWWLNTFRSGYVRRMAALRRGSTAGAPHEILDPRDLKFCRNAVDCEWSDSDDPFRWRSKIGFARWGLAELLLMGWPLLVATIALAVSPWWPVAVVPGVLFLLVVWFFRDPPRRVPSEPGLVVAPADGTVAEVTPIDHDDFIGGPAVRIGIFLSIFNVHINRAPVRSRVIKLHYSPGEFLNALNPESAIRNENLWIGLEEEAAPFRPMIVRQIAGLIARRIVCELRPGEVVERGHKFGMIKLGSRTELIIPAESGLQVLVQSGEKVRGGATAMARYATSLSPDP